MRNIGAALGFVVAVLGALGCSTHVDGGDSETHWVVCKTSADCHGGQTCERQRCVTPDAGPVVVTPDTGVPVVSTPDTGVPIVSTPDARPSTSTPDAPPSIANPTGSCVAPDSGARRGYQSPEPGDVWLPDCANPLKREYYRVFARGPKADASGPSAYVMPRPDGALALNNVCFDRTDPLHALVESYSLCAQASDPATVDRINHMRPADALRLTHYLHGQLIFEAQTVTTQTTVAVAPFPIPSDVLDACALHPDLSAALTADCAAERSAVDSGLEGALPDFHATASELAKLLNELYGVGDCTAKDFPTSVCTTCGLAGGCAKKEIKCTRACQSAMDCDGLDAVNGCMNSVCALMDQFCPF